MRTTQAVGLVVTVLVFFVLGIIALPAQNYSISPQTNSILQPILQNQIKIENELADVVHDGNYTFTDPLVLQNPYGSAPLTALVVFNTPDAVQISLHVPGKTPQAAVDFTFKEFSTHHEIPVYGLYANQTNQVSLAAKTLSGTVSNTTVSLPTEPLPVYLDSVKILHSDPDLYGPGMNLALQDNKLVFDINGDIRWYSTRSSFQTFTRLANGHYLFTYVAPKIWNAVVMEQDLLGKTYAAYNIPNGVQHDFAEMPNGNLLMTSQDSSSSTIEDILIEVNRRDGEIVRSFDLKKYLDYTRPMEIGFTVQDWLHFNSIAYDASDHSIILSGRTQSAVIKFSYPAMKIQWIMGPHDNWAARFAPHLLTPIDQPFEWQWSQHHVSLLSDQVVNGEKIVDLLMFDNGDYRSFDSASAAAPQDSYSRIVHYQINETRRTVRQVWDYGKDRGSEIFSSSRGSAYLLKNGDYLGTWAEIARDEHGNPLMKPIQTGTNTTKVIEVNPSRQQVVFEANLKSTTAYRILRVGLYDAYSGQDSVLSDKLNDTTVLNLKKSVITKLQPAKSDLNVMETAVKYMLRNVLKALGIWNPLQDAF